MRFTPGVSSCRGGAFLKLLVFLVVFGGILCAAWIFFMPMILTGTLSKRTGFDVQVQQLALNPFSAEVKVQGLLVANPHTFPRSEYLSVRSFQAKAPFLELFSESPAIDYVRIDIEQITFVRNSAGTLNAALFYDRLFPTPKPVAEPDQRPRKATKPGEKPAPRPAPKPQPERPSPKKIPFRIQRLELKLDRIITDDRAGRNPITKTYVLNIDQTYRDVVDPEQLITPAVVRSISPVATAITGLIPGSLGNVLNSAVDAPASKDPKKKTPQADVIKSLSDTLEESRKP